MRFAIIVLIYQLTILLTKAQEYITTNKKHVKRMIPSFYADFALTENRVDDYVKGSNAEIESEGCDKDECYVVTTTKGYSKEKAPNIAQKATQDAKAASEAQQAARHVAYNEVQMLLADNSMQTAKVGYNALNEKQQFVEQLEQEAQETEKVIEKVSTSLQNTQQNVKATIQAAQQAQAQLKILAQDVQATQLNVRNSEQAAYSVQNELAEKIKLMESAKTHVEQLLRLLNSARSDFINTKRATNDAKINDQRTRRHLSKRIKTPKITASVAKKPMY